jgi:hypothetical protein
VFGYWDSLKKGLLAGEKLQYDLRRLETAYQGNAMNEVCIESCAIKRDCSAFEVKEELKLEDMPRFPLSQSAQMTKEERFTSVTVYLAKVVDHLQGVEDESRLIKRPSIHNSGISQVLEGLQSEAILFSAKEEIASPGAGEEHSGKDERSS